MLNKLHDLVRKGDILVGGSHWAINIQILECVDAWLDADEVFQLEMSLIKNLYSQYLYIIIKAVA